MKVVILHQHFRDPGTGGAIRSYYLARALVDRGIKTVVITAHNDRATCVRNVAGIEVTYLPVPYDNRFGFWRRVLSFNRYMNKAVRAMSAHRDADLVYAISTPLTAGLAARRIRLKYSIPYIFEVGDLWPEAPIQMGVIRNPILKKALFWMEESIYRNALSIVALSEPIRKAVAAKAPDKSIHVVPNMADTDFFRFTDKEAELEEKFGVKGKFVVSYIGALGMANDLSLLLDCAAASLEANLPIAFFICGEGATRDDLIHDARRRQLQNVTFIPLQEKEGVRTLLNVTDANFISYRPVEVLETGCPNKYFDGLAAGKITIVNFGGWISEEIKKYKCGFRVDPLNPVDFTEKMKPFLADRSLVESYQKAARLLAETTYAREVLSDQFARVITAS